MAELDRFERTLKPGWRAAYRLARAAVASDEEIGDKLVKTLTKTLREGAGVPGLSAMVEIVAAADELSILEQFNALDAIVKGHGDRHSKVAAEVAKSFLVQPNIYAGAIEPNSAVHQLIAGVCVALVEHYFYANARQHLITEGKIADHEGARLWQAQIERLVQPAIEKIADQLADNHDAKGLRSPRRMVRKESTIRLLEEELLTPQYTGST